jgi:hypothetical protein
MERSKSQWKWSSIGRTLVLTGALAVLPTSLTVDSASAAAQAPQRPSVGASIEARAELNPTAVLHAKEATAAQAALTERAPRPAPRTDWNAYFRCVLGAGVPAGLGWFVVGALGTAKLLHAALIWATRGQGGPPVAGWFAQQIIKRYVVPVWNNCRRFVGS